MISLFLSVSPSCSYFSSSLELIMNSLSLFLSNVRNEWKYESFKKCMEFFGKLWIVIVIDFDLHNIQKEWMNK